MEPYILSLILISIIFFIFFVIKICQKSTVSELPPGPKAWPIIGNIHQLGDRPHCSVTELSKKYGSIMTLKLGTITTIVISSPEVAREMFLKHDLTFSSRAFPDGATVSNHHKHSMVWLPVGPKWREFRKIAVVQLFTNHRLDSSQGSYDSSSLQEFKDIVWPVLELAGKPNVSDFFPLVRHLDLQGVLRKISVYYKKTLEVFNRIIEKRLRDGITVKDDVLGTLLKLVEDNELSLKDVIHMLMLPYIQAVVKETFRLHPPAPFLIPHKAEKDVQLCGFSIPKDAQIWVYVWSIGRDSSVWPNALSFMPERFMDSEVNFKGRSFELIPFGAGRRMCPGMPLAHRMVHLMLATLLHSFNWKHAHGLCPKDIDVEEKFGLTLQKAQPLQAIPLIR
ncbi:cytochrome P450 76T24-like [Silene latifolia]|uniref:cytochrome P450 76T24-like n=1 Tax=Silene latifolia TaxID=37657 RepID=UPI003D76E319